MKVLDAEELDLLFPSRDETFFLTLDRILPVEEGLSSYLFSLPAMDEAGHVFESCNGNVYLFDGHLIFPSHGKIVQALCI